MSRPCNRCGKMIAADDIPTHAVEHMRVEMNMPEDTPAEEVLRALQERVYRQTVLANECSLCEKPSTQVWLRVSVDDKTGAVTHKRGAIARACPEHDEEVGRLVEMGVFK